MRGDGTLGKSEVYCDPTSQVLTVEKLAALIHKSPSSIRSDASRNPDALPPICRLPGNKRLLWRMVDVQSWLAKHVETKPGSVPSLSSASSTDHAVRKRGRPRKTISSMASFDLAAPFLSVADKAVSK